MWCTRWFLVLFLLPYPRASPLFLVLYLFSLILHSRPCLYCVVLLTALFTSSCYWAPTYLPTPSFFPASQNITVATPPEDRCWCDINNGNVFDPFPPFVSSTHSQPDLSTVKFEQAAKPEPGYIPPLERESAAENPPNARPTPVRHSSRFTSGIWEALRGKLWRGSAGMAEEWGSSIPDAPQPVEAGVLDAQDDSRASPNVDGLGHLPWVRRQYDLREYGIGLIVDFGWGRKKETVGG